MGIKNLNKFIRKHAPGVRRTKSLSCYRGMKVAIDTCIYIHKFKSKNKFKWVHSFLMMVRVLLKYDIIPLFVYDGASPPEKNDKKQERREKKNSIESKIQTIRDDLAAYDSTGVISETLWQVNNRRQGSVYKMLNVQEQFDRKNIEKELLNLDNKITNVWRSDYDLTKEILEGLGIMYIDSDDEGETLCSQLCVLGLVDAVMSDDTDVLVYGTPMALAELNIPRETVCEVCPPELFNELDITPEMFKDFCILCGTDYNHNKTIPRVGPENAFKLIKQAGCIERIPEIRVGTDIEVLNYPRIRQIFSIPESVTVPPISKKSGDRDKLTATLDKHGISIPRNIFQSLFK